MASVPSPVSKLLQSSKYLHLGTCANDRPHVSLMNYTWLDDEKLIVTTTQRDTQKYQNIVSNKYVSVLVHDWTTAKSNSSTNDGTASVLSQLLQDLNKSEISSISATLEGVASIEDDKERSAYYKEKHLLANPGAECFIKGDDIAVVVIRIDSAKVATSKNQISEWK